MRSGSSSILVVPGIVISVLTIAVLFQLAPMIGGEVEQVSSISTPATGTLMFYGEVADAETVTIGDEVYEFDTGDGVSGGHYEVDVGDTSIATATANLTAVINSVSGLVSAEVGDDSVVVTALVAGSAGNNIGVNETLANASWVV